MWDRDGLIIALSSSSISSTFRSDDLIIAMTNTLKAVEGTAEPSEAGSFVRSTFLAELVELGLESSLPLCVEPEEVDVSYSMGPLVD